MRHSIYVIGRHGSERPCKIGISAAPDRRLAQLQTGSAEVLVLRCVCERADATIAAFHERLAHDHFAPVRMAGEWFDADADEILAVLEGLVDQTPGKKKRQRKPQARAESFGKGSEPFHPQIPQDLFEVPISEMSYPDRVRFWSACELPPPPEGFDDWYIVGTPAIGVIGAFPVVGFVCQEPK